MNGSPVTAAASDGTVMTAERPSREPIGRPGPAWRGDGALAPRRVHPAHRPLPADDRAEGRIPFDVARLATFPRRAAGHAIDLLIIISAALLVQILVGGAQEAQVMSVFLMQLGYNWIFNSLGWSPGKRLRGLRLVTADGEPPGPGRGLTRALVAFVSGFLFLAGLGYFWAIWDGKRQTWHDKVAGTYVVTVEDDEAHVRA